MNILITGAAGNLGGLLARHILENERDLNLILMKHLKAISPDVQKHPKVQVRVGDLADIGSLHTCLNGADTIVHFAGVLFKANPETFLYETNIRYFQNLVSVAKAQGVDKIILISFPHVEGPTSREKPACGVRDGDPVSVHAQTRLEQEKYLFTNFQKSVSLRVGMVYGKGILMIDAARWFAKRGLLGVWKEQTEIHLISKIDFCRAVTTAIKKEDANGTYHIGDDGDDTLQSFLDRSCELWGCKKPWRMPLWLIYAAAELCELNSRLFGTLSPLTKDFIDIGRVSYYGDTSRFRKELLPVLRYPTINEGIKEMVE